VANLLIQDLVAVNSSGVVPNTTRGSSTGFVSPSTISPRVRPLLVSDWYFANQAELSQMAQRLAEAQGK
jgi:hypothetical protein